MTVTSYIIRCVSGSDRGRYASIDVETDSLSWTDEPRYITHFDSMTEAILYLINAGLDVMVYNVIPAAEGVHP